VLGGVQPLLLEESSEEDDGEENTIPESYTLLGDEHPLRCVVRIKCQRLPETGLPCFPATTRGPVWGRCGRCGSALRRASKRPARTPKVAFGPSLLRTPMLN